MVFVISGCDRNSFLEKTGLKEKITNVIQIKHDIVYLPNSDAPFTGKYVTYYVNGQKKSETNYLDGKEHELASLWYEKTGQKESETRYQDGKENVLVIR